MVFHFDILAIFGIGYLVGLSIITGFILAEIRRRHVHGKPVWRDVAWIAFACINIFLGAINAVTAFIMFVAGDGGMGRGDFWPRAVVYVAGIGVGAAFIAVSAKLLKLVPVEAEGPCTG